MAVIAGNGSVSYINGLNHTFKKTNLGDEPNIPLYTFILVLMLNSIIFIMGISLVLMTGLDLIRGALTRDLI